MARETLSDQVEFKRTKYGIELFREVNNENIKITNYELERLSELIE